MDKLPVLIAEDNLINRRLASIIVGQLGYPYRLVSTGAAAVKAAAAEDFLCVLMDIEMPDMNGYEACAAIRQLPGRRGRVPVIAMTAHAGRSGREHFLDQGMSDYLSKPIDRGILASILYRVSGSGAGPAPGGDIVRDTADRILDNDLLDKLRHMQHEDEPDIVTELVNMFVKLVPAEIQQLREAIESHDARQQQKLAHSIKGSCRNLGVHRIARLCTRLEETESISAKESALAILEEIERDLPSVIDALEKVRVT